MQNETIEYQFTKELKDAINKNIAKYPDAQKQSSILFALMETQKSVGGWLQDKHLRAVAEILEIQPIVVYEVATFYTMINLSPIGTHRINICTNISCKLKGSAKIVNYIEKYLDIKIGETTKDKKVTFSQSECLAACVGAPMMMVDDKYHENLNEDKVKTILDKLTGKASGS